MYNQYVLDAVAQTTSGMVVELVERHEALRSCLKKLHARDRELLLSAI